MDLYIHIHIDLPLPPLLARSPPELAEDAFVRILLPVMPYAQTWEYVCVCTCKCRYMYVSVCACVFECIDVGIDSAYVCAYTCSVSRRRSFVCCLIHIHAFMYV